MPKRPTPMIKAYKSGNMLRQPEKTEPAGLTDFIGNRNNS